MIDKVIHAFYAINEELEKNKAYLTDLDRKIGDADHGENMARGWSSIIMVLEQTPPTSIYELFSIAGKTLLNKVGGASGPLYGMAFIKGAQAFKNNDKITLETLKSFIGVASTSIKTLGKADIKHKTMLDVWIPIYNDLESNNNIESLIKKLEEYTQSTKDMQAIIGRASYLKERSIGTIDPGSASTKIILTELFKVLKG